MAYTEFAEKLIHKKVNDQILHIRHISIILITIEHMCSPIFISIFYNQIKIC